MAELATIARPYANAVFALARENGVLDLWARRLGVMAAAAGEQRVRTLLESPEVPAERKAFHLADVCGDEVDDRGRRFLLVLARNGRLGLLGEISRRFEELKAAEERNLDVEVLSHLSADRGTGRAPQGCAADEIRQGSEAHERRGREPARRRHRARRGHGHRRLGARQARQARRIAGQDLTPGDARETRRTGQGDQDEPIDTMRSRRSGS